MLSILWLHILRTSSRRGVCGVRTVVSLPTLPPGFYDQSEALHRIRHEAQAHRCPPDAVLGAVLCRLSTLVPISTTVNGDSPNYFVALVGFSGAGKTASMRCARRLIPHIGTDLDGLPVSSGEGLVQSYLGLEKVDGKQQQTQVYESAFFYVDEGQQLLVQADRQGSTTGPMLRSMWAGEATGTTGARVETTRRLRPDSYRISLLVGLQPDYASTLLADDHAGTPQRFLWLSCRDPQPPIIAPHPRGPLKMPEVISGPIKVGESVQRTIDNFRTDALRTGGSEDSRSSQEPVLLLRTGYLLALLNGRPGELDGDDWLAAIELVEHSKQVSRSLDLIARKRRQEQHLEQDTETVERREYRENLQHEKRLDRIARGIAKRLREDGPTETPKVRRRVAYRDTNYFDEAVMYGCKVGLIVPIEKGFQAGPVKP